MFAEVHWPGSIIGLKVVVFQGSVVLCDDNDGQYWLQN